MKNKNNYNYMMMTIKQTMKMMKMWIRMSRLITIIRNKEKTKIKVNFKFNQKVVNFYILIIYK